MVFWNISPFVAKEKLQTIYFINNTYETFISKGIFFECECLKMASTKDEISSVLALEYGLPCNKSNHKDERFVHEKI